MYRRTNYEKKNELKHHGIKGQKWGLRRYQNADGSWTAEGRKRYLKSDGTLNVEGNRLALSTLRGKNLVDNKNTIKSVEHTTKKRIGRNLAVSAGIGAAFGMLAKNCHNTSSGKALAIGALSAIGSATVSSYFTSVSGKRDAEDIRNYYNYGEKLIASAEKLINYND